MNVNEYFEKEDAELAEKMQAWLPEEKYILLEPSILIRGLECVGIALSAGFIGAAVVAAITKI